MYAVSLNLYPSICSTFTINAMPSLPPSVTDDDNIALSTLSELDSDQFTQSTEDNASSDSQPNTQGKTTSQTPLKKHKQTATSTWSLAREPLPYEPICDGRN